MQLEHAAGRRGDYRPWWRHIDAWRSRYPLGFDDTGADLAPQRVIRRLGELAALPLSPRLIRNLSVVYPKEKFRSRLVNTFVQFAKERLASRLAG